jgi:hypothetical protein
MIEITAVGGQNRVKIELLKNWDKNPRNITPEGYERLKRKIQRLKEFKPLLITPDGIVLGGNMRLRAYKELGFNSCWVSVVAPKDEQEMLEFALADNDQDGYTDTDLMANFLGNFGAARFEDYGIFTSPALNVKEFAARFDPATAADWAAAFESSGDTRNIAGFEQITFVLKKEDMQKLKDKLSGYSGNKNEAIVIWLTN